MVFLDISLDNMIATTSTNGAVVLWNVDKATLCIIFFSIPG